MNTRGDDLPKPELENKDKGTDFYCGTTASEMTEYIHKSSNEDIVSVLPVLNTLCVSSV